MTLTAILFIMIGRKIGLRQRLLIQESLNQSTIAGLVRLTKKIFWGTLIVEGTGAAALSLCFIPMYGLKKGITYGIFHAVSAFCNAGFDLIGENSLAPLVGHWGVNLVLMLLIVAGSIGFGVWFDVIGAGRKVFRQKRSNHGWFWHTQLHTKLALVITAGLLFSGWLLIFLLEAAGKPVYFHAADDYRRFARRNSRRHQNGNGWDFDFAGAGDSERPAGTGDI